MSLIKFMEITVDKALLLAIDKLRNTSWTDWQKFNKQMQLERIRLIPEAVVVDAIRAYIDGAYAPKEEHARLWQEVLKAIRDLDESELERVKRMEEYYNKKWGKIA